MRARARIVLFDTMKSKNEHAVALSKLGSSKGGIARSAGMTAAERKHSARVAAIARWKKKSL